MLPCFLTSTKLLNTWYEVSGIILFGVFIHEKAFCHFRLAQFFCINSMLDEGQDTFWLYDISTLERESKSNKLRSCVYQQSFFFSNLYNSTGVAPTDCKEEY